MGKQNPQGKKTRSGFPGPAYSNTNIQVSEEIEGSRAVKKRRPPTGVEKKCIFSLKLDVKVDVK